MLDEDNALPAFLPLTEIAGQENILVQRIAEEIIATVPDFSFLFRSKGTLKELLLKTIKGLPASQLRTALLQNISFHVITVENRYANNLESPNRMLIILVILDFNHPLNARNDPLMQ